MSFKVVVIPEDDRLDKYILTPVLKAALAHIGKPHATVTMVSNPHPRGIDTVLKDEFFERVTRRYGVADLFLYCIDRDASTSNDNRLRDLVSRVASLTRPSQRVDGRTAHQEIEVWGIAGSDLSLVPDSWETVRAHRDPKEAYFRPLAEAMNVHLGPGAGREHIGRLAGDQYARVRQLCPELQEIEAILLDAAG